MMANTSLSMLGNMLLSTPENMLSCIPGNTSSPADYVVAAYMIVS